MRTDSSRDEGGTRYGRGGERCGVGFLGNEFGEVMAWEGVCGFCMVRELVFIVVVYELFSLLLVVGIVNTYIYFVHCHLFFPIGFVRT